LNLKGFNAYLLAMTKDKQERKEILQEIEALCTMHERITQSSECREFNRRSALLLQRLEDEGCFRLADRAMDLLASCNPKDLSQCDSVQRARDILEKLRVLAKENTEK
jgi:16S rRNA G1207 methylase RsmC